MQTQERNKKDSMYDDLKPGSREAQEAEKVPLTKETLQKAMTGLVDQWRQLLVRENEDGSTGLQRDLAEGKDADYFLGLSPLPVGAVYTDIRQLPEDRLRLNQVAAQGDHERQYNFGFNMLKPDDVKALAAETFGSWDAAVQKALADNETFEQVSGRRRHGSPRVRVPLSDGVNYVVQVDGFSKPGGGINDYNWEPGFSNAEMQLGPDPSLPAEEQPPTAEDVINAMLADFKTGAQ